MNLRASSNIPIGKVTQEDKVTVKLQCDINIEFYLDFSWTTNQSNKD